MQIALTANCQASTIFDLHITAIPDESVSNVAVFYFIFSFFLDYLFIDNSTKVETAFSVETKSICRAVGRVNQCRISVLMKGPVKMGWSHGVLLVFLYTFQVKCLKLALRQENVLQGLIIWIIC